MAFKVGIFVAKKGGGERLVKWLSERYDSHEKADVAVEQKNKDLGVRNQPLPGQKFAMYDQA